MTEKREDRRSWKGARERMPLSQGLQETLRRLCCIDSPSPTHLHLGVRCRSIDTVSCLAGTCLSRQEKSSLVVRTSVMCVCRRVADEAGGIPNMRALPRLLARFCLGQSLVRGGTRASEQKKESRPTTIFCYKSTQCVHGRRFGRNQPRKDHGTPFYHTKVLSPGERQKQTVSHAIFVFPSLPRFIFRPPANAQGPSSS